MRAVRFVDSVSASARGNLRFDRLSRDPQGAGAASAGAVTVVHGGDWAAQLLARAKGKCEEICGASGSHCAVTCKNCVYNCHEDLDAWKYQGVYPGAEEDAAKVKACQAECHKKIAKEFEDE